MGSVFEHPTLQQTPPRYESASASFEETPSTRCPYGGLVLTSDKMTSSVICIADILDIATVLLNTPELTE